MSFGQDFLNWAVGVFGPVAVDPHERALRFVEEAIELGQSQNIRRSEIIAIMVRVYDRPAGKVDREIGQCAGTLAMLATNLGYSVDTEAKAEFDRVKSLPPEHWQARHQAKVDLGIARSEVQS